MNQRLKILFLPKWYPNKFDPFAGNFIENHARAVNIYCSVVVLFVHSDNEAKTIFNILEQTEASIPVIRVYFKKPPNIPVIGPLVTGIRYIRSQFKGYRVIREKYGQPDICHVHVLTRPAFLAWWLKLKKGIPYIISEHWSGYFPESNQYQGLIKKVFTRFFVSRSSMVTTVSEYLKDAMIKNKLKNKYTIIPNVVDTHVFKPSSSEVHENIKKIIHISTLDIIPKNVPGILRTIKKLLKKRADFELHILGDGKDRKKVEAEAQRLGLLNKKVFFYGNLPMSEVADHLRGSNCLILFSHYENQPCVMIEAFSAGVPVIAPRVGGIPEHLNQERGVFVSPKNEQELLEALNWMLDNFSTFNTQQLHIYAKDNFSQESVGQKFLDSYLDLLKTN